tara:strand:+ start:531 stop:803 length:273 start_codon:yes stop_codon:yes gene_type:complete
MSNTYGLDDRFAKDQDGNTVVIAKVGDPKPNKSAAVWKLEALKTIFDEADLALGRENTWAESLAAAKHYDKARQAYFAAYKQSAAEKPSN